MAYFSSRLLVIRGLHQISQSELAKEVHVARQTIASIEMGTRAPSLYTAMKIAKFFGETVESVFTFRESKK